MENKNKLSTGALVALIVIAALNVLWIVCNLVLYSANIIFQVWAPIVMFAIAAIYTVYGYKKPHGNHIRYLLLIHSVYMGSLLIAYQSTQSAYACAVTVAKIILSTYMAGRLDRYKQNLIISIVILALNIVSVYLLISMAIKNDIMSFAVFFSCIGPVTIWLAIAASYIIRYKPHREAGLADK